MEFPNLNKIKQKKEAEQKSIESGKKSSWTKDKFEIVKFVDNEFQIDVRADKENETVQFRLKIIKNILVSLVPPLTI